MAKKSASRSSLPKAGALGQSDSIFGSRPSECTLEGDICVRQDGIQLLAKFLRTQGTEVSSKQRKPVIDAALKVLNLTKESEIWSHPLVLKAVGQRVADLQQRYYKPVGPAGTTNLISSVNINDTMKQWAEFSKDLFGKRFYFVPYQMDDFLEKHTALAELDLAEIRKEYDCFACILNTDPSTRDGEHWYCIYGDLRHAGTKQDPITLEYFNSSGNRVERYRSIHTWLTQNQHELLRDHGLHAEIVTSATRQIQFSNTECGVWSLCYIHSRLEGHPPEYFTSAEMTDDDMYQYRLHLFRPE